MYFAVPDEVRASMRTPNDAAVAIEGWCFRSLWIWSVRGLGFGVCQVFSALLTALLAIQRLSLFSLQGYGHRLQAAAADNQKGFVV